MVFSIDTVLDSKNKIPSTMVNEEVIEEKSAFDEAVEIFKKMINSMKLQYLDNFKVLKINI